MSYKYNRMTVKKLNIKGKLSDDGKTISYLNADKEELHTTVENCFDKFKGMPIEFTLALKTDEDLSGETEEE